jgi:hypothetical protein
LNAKFVSLLVVLLSLVALALAPSGCAGCDNDDEAGCNTTHSTCVNGCDPLAADYNGCVEGCNDDLCTCLDDAGCGCES